MPLTPYTFGRAKLSDLLETRTISAGQLDEAALTNARVVVLANVPRLKDDQVAALTDYVRGGGSALFFLGNKTDLDWHNRALHGEPANLLPMQLVSRAGSADGERDGVRIVAQRFEHPALEIFNDRTSGNLADAEIWNWYRMGRQGPGPGEAETTGSDNAVVMARLETGDPLIAERRLGDGIVVQVATACDADWSTLPMQPSFLPLMQQLVTTLAMEAMPTRNIETGSALVALLPEDQAGQPLLLTFPDGTRQTTRPVARGRQSVARFDRTGQPGVYTLTGPDSKPIHFVAQAPRRESDLRRLTEEELTAVAEELDADVVESAQEFLALEHERRHGREIWRFLLLALLGLMVAELFLQQRFARVRT